MQALFPEFRWKRVPSIFDETSETRSIQMQCEGLEKRSPLHRAREWVSELECERSFGTQMDVFLSSEKGSRCSCCRTHGPTDQRTLTSTSSAAYPRPVAFLVVTASPPRRSGTDVVVLSAHGHGFQREL